MFDTLKVVCASMMVRPEKSSTPRDFGTFHSQPGDYFPASVRFLVVKVPYTDFGALSREFSLLARTMSPNEGGAA